MDQDHAAERKQQERGRDYRPQDRMQVPEEAEAELPGEYAGAQNQHHCHEEQAVGGRRNIGSWHDPAGRDERSQGGASQKQRNTVLGRQLVGRQGEGREAHPDAQRHDSPQRILALKFRLTSQQQRNHRSQAGDTGEPDEHTGKSVRDRIGVETSGQHEIGVQPGDHGYDDHHPASSDLKHSKFPSMTSWISRLVIYYT